MWTCPGDDDITPDSNDCGGEKLDELDSLDISCSDFEYRSPYSKTLSFGGRNLYYILGMGANYTAYSYAKTKETTCIPITCNMAYNVLSSVSLTSDAQDVYSFKPSPQCLCYRSSPYLYIHSSRRYCRPRNTHTFWNAARCTASICLGTSHSVRWAFQRNASCAAKR